MRGRRDAQKTSDEPVLAEQPFTGTTATLTLRVAAGAQCQFNIGPSFTARPGRWVGAKVGVFAAGPPAATITGSVTVKAFTVGSLIPYR